MNREERAARAIRIREIMEDGDLKAAFQSVIDQHVEKWMTCKDAVERDDLWRTVHAVRLVQQELATLSSEVKGTS